MYPPSREPGINEFRARVVNAVYLGSFTDYKVRIGDLELRVQLPPTEKTFRIGEEVIVKLDEKKLVVIPS